VVGGTLVWSNSPALDDGQDKPGEPPEGIMEEEYATAASRKQTQLNLLEDSNSSTSSTELVSPKNPKKKLETNNILAVSAAAIVASLNSDGMEQDNLSNITSSCSDSAVPDNIDDNNKKRKRSPKTPHANLTLPGNFPVNPENYPVTLNESILTS